MLWNVPLVVPGRETLGKYPHFNSFHVHIFLNVKMTTFMTMIIYHKQEMGVGWLSHILPGAASTPGLQSAFTHQLCRHIWEHRNLFLCLFLKPGQVRVLDMWILLLCQEACELAQSF